MGEIRCIRDGVEIAPPGEPNPELIAYLERILDMARTGQISAVAAAVQHSDRSVTSEAVGTYGMTLIGEIELMKFTILAEVTRA